MNQVEFLQELLNALGSSLEKAEAQQAALLQFLKDKGVVSEEEFAPYLAKAETTSGVRWRATRVRLDSLIAKEQEREERAREEKAAKPDSGHADKAPPEQGSRASGDVTAKGDEGKPRTGGPDPFKDVDKQVAGKDEQPDGSKTAAQGAKPQSADEGAARTENKTEAGTAGA